MCTQKSDFFCLYRFFKLIYYLRDLFATTQIEYSRFFIINTQKPQTTCITIIFFPLSRLWSSAHPSLSSPCISIRTPPTLPSPKVTMAHPVGSSCTLLAFLGNPIVHPSGPLPPFHRLGNVSPDI